MDERNSSLVVGIGDDKGDYLLYSIDDRNSFGQKIVFSLIIRRNEGLMKENN